MVPSRSDLRRDAVETKSEMPNQQVSNTLTAVYTPFLNTVPAKPLNLGKVFIFFILFSIVENSVEYSWPPTFSRMAIDEAKIVLNNPAQKPWRRSIGVQV